jgi:hypothetical protein
MSFVLKHLAGFGSYTSLPAQFFSTAERTGSPILIVLWSIAKIDHDSQIDIMGHKYRRARDTLR